MQTNPKVLEFWESQALTHKESNLATIADPHYRMLEIRKIIEQISGTERIILDIGCGNGFSTIHFAKAFPNIQFVGADYSPAMIEFANKELASLKLENLKFVVGNVLEPEKIGCNFDAIISTRCLINLDGWPQQRDAILQLHSALKPGGRLILAEHTKEGLARTNAMRAILDLPAIPMRWHNQYLPENVVRDFLNRNFNIASTENIGSLYYLISKVVYAKYAQMKGEEPQYTHQLNEIASKLPSIGDLSPCFLFVCQRRVESSAQDDDALERDISAAYVKQYEKDIAKQRG